MGYIAPIGAFDQTDTIIQFNEFSKLHGLWTLSSIHANHRKALPRNQQKRRSKATSIIRNLIARDCE